MKWSKQELDELVELYPYLGLKPTALALGRSISSVRNKAEYLGLRTQELTAARMVAHALTSERMTNHWARRRCN